MKSNCLILLVVVINLISCNTSTIHVKTFTFSPNDVIDWEKINDGDTICLTGVHTGTIEVNKNITIDGHCEDSGSLTGLVTPIWEIAGSVWKTVEKFPVYYGRYSSWVLLNGELKTLEDANIYRTGDYFYSKVKPNNIQIPKYYSGIVAKGTTGLTIRNIDVSYYHTNGIRVSNSSNTLIDNVTVSWVGGGTSFSTGNPKAGDCITFDGNTENVLVKDSYASQCYDVGFAMQLFKNFKQQAKHIRFINVHADKCGAGLSVSTHYLGGSVIDDVEIVGEFTNLGYGWSGTNNNVHGRGVLVKQFDSCKITNVKLHNSVIDTFKWVGVLHLSGELDAWNNVIKNGTGEYELDKYIRPAAYTAHGMDYSADPSDDEAIGSFHNNTITNNKGYAFQVINNTPKASTRQLTIKNNTVSGNTGESNIRASSGLIY